MDKHTESWKSTGFWRSTSKDVPQTPLDYATNTGSIPVWTYVETMQGDGETEFLRYRFAHMNLFLTYATQFDRFKKSGVPDQTAKRRAADIICGIRDLPKGAADEIRRSFHDRKLIGEYWWWCCHNLGRGFILSCIQETGFKM